MRQGFLAQAILPERRQRCGVNLFNLKDMKRIRILMLAGAALMLYACAKDNLADGPPDSDGQNTFLSSLDSGIRLSFDVASQKRVRALNPAQDSELAPAEQVLMAPEVTVAKVDFEMDTLGNFAGQVQVLPHDAGYPEGMIGKRAVPKAYQLGRMEFSNGQVAYYNTVGELIQADGFCEKIAQHFQTLATDLGSHATLEPDAFAAVMQGWGDAGYEVESISGGHQVINIPLPDGRRSQMLIDTEKQAVVGNAHYDSSGELLSSSVTLFKGPASAPEEVLYRFLAPAKGPLSGTDLAIVYQSHLTNISITLKN